MFFQPDFLSNMLSLNNMLPRVALSIYQLTFNLLQHYTALHYTKFDDILHNQEFNSLGTAALSVKTCNNKH